MDKAPIDRALATRLTSLNLALDSDIRLVCSNKYNKI